MIRKLKKRMNRQFIEKIKIAAGDYYRINEKFYGKNRAVKKAFIETMIEEMIAIILIDQSRYIQKIIKRITNFIEIIVFSLFFGFIFVNYFIISKQEISIFLFIGVIIISFFILLKLFSEMKKELEGYLKDFFLDNPLELCEEFSKILFLFLFNSKKKVTENQIKKKLEEFSFKKLISNILDTEEAKELFDLENRNKNLILDNFYLLIFEMMKAFSKELEDSNYKRGENETK